MKTSSIIFVWLLFCLLYLSRFFIVILYVFHKWSVLYYIQSIEWPDSEPLLSLKPAVHHNIRNVFNYILFSYHSWSLLSTYPIWIFTQYIIFTHAYHTMDRWLSFASAITLCLLNSSILASFQCHFNLEKSTILYIQSPTQMCLLWISIIEFWLLFHSLISSNILLMCVLACICSTSKPSLFITTAIHLPFIHYPLSIYPLSKLFDSKEFWILEY